MHVSPITLSEIKRTSPTLWSHMHLGCWHLLENRFR
jgi:hypothetical protein